MSLRYSTTPRVLFKTAAYRDLSANARHVYRTLRDSRGTALPELIQADPGDLVSDTGLLFPQIEEALTELVAANIVTVDARHGLMRVREIVPVTEKEASYTTLTGWWRCYEQLVDCPLKASIVADLKRLLNFDGHKMSVTWKETFGASDGASEGACEGPSDAPSDGASDASVQRAVSSMQHEEQEHLREQGSARSESERSGQAGAERPSALTLEPDAPTPYSCTREQALAAIAEASGGHFIASKAGKGGVFKLDRLRRSPDAIAICQRIGRWMLAGGDEWRGVLDGRAIGGSLDAWIAQSAAWTGGPVTRTTPAKRRTGQADPGDFSDSATHQGWDT